MIKPEEVAKLAELARIEVAPAEQEKLRQDLSKILDYASELKKVSGKVRPESGSALARANIWREDVPVVSPATREELLKAAPSSQAGYFKVKKILG